MARLLLKGEEAALGANTGAANAFSSARLVRVVNTNTSNAYLVTLVASVGGAVLGSLIGLVLGAIWFTIFQTAGYDSLLYFNELASNNVQCSKPSKQTFKCSVYKNGELVSSNIA